MPEATITTLMNDALVTVLIVSLPALVLAAGVGLIVGLLQAVTQIQDQTLPMAIKVISVTVLLVFLGGLLAEPVMRHAERVFDDFDRLTSPAG